MLVVPCSLCFILRCLRNFDGFMFYLDNMWQHNTHCDDSSYSGHMHTKPKTYILVDAWKKLHVSLNRRHQHHRQQNICILNSARLCFSQNIGVPKVTGLVVQNIKLHLFVRNSLISQHFPLRYTHFSLRSFYCWKPRWKNSLDVKYSWTHALCIMSSRDSKFVVSSFCAACGTA